MGYKYRNGSISSPNHKSIMTKPMVPMNSTKVPQSSQANPKLATGSKTPAAGKMADMKNMKGIKNG